MRKTILLLAVCFSILGVAADAQTKQPRTVREFFNLLPQKYFTLEGCQPSKDKNCERARREYIETFLEVEDAANGFWKSGCDGAQSCLTMALFKRPNQTYVVAVQTEFEMGSENYFLEYKNGKWFDISSQIIPQFSKNNFYELPQKGTTVGVFKKNAVDDGITEKGEKLYDLLWENGKFVRQN
ncbi:MAG: hypothetical protein LH614_15985 [Pyrinomonadaceae bacterium]|nr:hypothetical protein [Pyrinomonadaceae bacterium]